MTTAFVTGATGFVGANVVRALLKRGRNVRTLVRPTSDLGNLENLNTEIIIGDLKDRSVIRNATKGCDEVYHVAAEYNFWTSDRDSIYRNNIDGTRNVLEAALAEKCRRVVYTSTVGTIGLSDQVHACNETTLMAPDQLTGHYKKSKFQAEQLALSFVAKGLPLVVVNPSAPIGPFDRKPTPTGKVIVDFVNGKMPAFVETGLNLVHVEDVAEGHILAAEKGRIGERYILGSQNLSLSEILKKLEIITGRSAPKVQIPYAIAYIVGLIDTKISDWVTHQPPHVALEAVKMSKRHMYFDATKAIQELGLPQTSVDRALEDAVNWFAKNNYFDKN